MIVDRHNLGVSSATVRNDMAVLEEDGLIAQPHTSAGRVPTDKGYRMFVDRLTQVKPLSAAERRAVQAFLDGAVDLDDVHAPQCASARPAHPAGGGRAVPDAHPLHGAALRGRRVDARPADARADHRLRPGRPAGGRSRRGAHRRRRRRVAGDGQRRAVRVGRSPQRRSPWPIWPTAPPKALRGVVTTVATVLIETLVEHPEERLVLGRHGQPHTQRRRFPRLPAADPGGAGGAGGGAQAARLGAGPRYGDGTHRRRERSRGDARHQSVVSIGYGMRTVLGGMGVVGPTRMDYPGSMAAVHAVARYVGEILAGTLVRSSGDF